MRRGILLGVAVLAFSMAAVACSDDDEGDADATNTPSATAEATDTGSLTAEPSGPTEPLNSEIPQEAIDATEAYIVAGNVASFPPVDEIVPADQCNKAGQVCYDLDDSTFEKTTATIRVYSYASDDVQNVMLENQDGTWVAIGSSNATE